MTFSLQLDAFVVFGCGRFAYSTDGSVWNDAECANDCEALSEAVALALDCDSTGRCVAAGGIGARSVRDTRAEEAAAECSIVESADGGASWNVTGRCGVLATLGALRPLI